ncbi:MAG: glycosyltransferase family 39 protein [Candidatus Micrarchaeota archaeon]
MVDFIALLAGLAVFVGAFSFGKALLSTLGAGFRDWIEEYSYALMLGLLFFSLYGFFVAAMGIAIPDAFLILVVLSLVVGLSELHKALNERKYFPFPKDLESKIIVFLIAGLMAVNLLSSLAVPSTGSLGPIDWDSLTYHLLAPAQILSEHSFSFQPLLPHLNWPIGFEMIYLAAMALGGVVAARFLSFLVSLALVLFIYSFAKRFVSQKNALIAAAIFSSIPLVNIFFGTGYIDLHLTFAILLSLNALFAYQETKKKRWLFLSAVNAGFAAGIKLIGLAYAFVFTLWFLYYDLRDSVKKGLAKAIAFIALVVGIASPWYLKNFFNTGNPVWPLHYSFFNFLGVSANAQSAYFNQVWALQSAQSGVGHSVIDLILLPFTTVFNSTAFNGIITPLILMFLPLFFFIKKKNHQINALLILSGVFTVFCFYAFQEARFLLPVFAMLSIACAFFIENNSLNLQKVIPWIVIIVLAGTLATTMLYKYNSFPNALGLESNNAYLERTYPMKNACDYFTSNYDGKVFGFKQEALYYCERPVYSLYYDYSSMTPDAWRNDLKQRGVQVVLAPKTTFNDPILVSLVNGQKKVFEDEAFVLYELN